MKLCSAGLAFALLTSSWCSALPPKQESRVHDVKLSEKAHDDNGEHNNDYDHDAFLGEEEARDFEDLTPEESKQRLGAIVDKIDQDNDGYVTEGELQVWIQYVQKKYVNEDTDRSWKDHNLDDDGKLTWDSYRKRTFGYEYAMGDDSEELHRMERRDERRFRQSDVDRDGKLSLEEFTAFTHPDNFPHMHEIVVLETIEDIDKDKDGYISLEEYIADLEDGEDEEDDEDDENLNDWKESEKEQFKSFRDKNGDGKLDKEEVKQWIIPDDFDNSSSEAQHLVRNSDADKVLVERTPMSHVGNKRDMWPNKEDDEPEWVKNEREQFSTYRDANGDGRMDKDEVKNWIIPPNYDHSEAEAKHLIYESDQNKDGKLTKEEILDNYDIFVGSQATDFGEALTRHDEF